MGVSKAKLTRRFPSLEASSDDAVRAFVHSTGGGWWLGVVARVVGPLFFAVLTMLLCAVALLLLLAWGLRSKVLDDSTDAWMVLVVGAAALPVVGAFVAWLIARRRLVVRRVGDAIAEGGGPGLALPRGLPRSRRARQRYVVELVAMAVIAAAPFVWMGTQWAMICAEARRARALKPGAAGLNKLISTLPPAQGRPGEAVWLTFAGLWKTVDDVEERVWEEMGSPTYSNGNRLSPAYVNIGLDPAKVPEERRAEFVLEQQMAERMLTALDSAGVYDTVAGIVGNSNVDVGVPPFTNDQAIALLPRPGVRDTFNALRFNIGRMAMAIKTKNLEEFSEAFEVFTAAEHVFEREPFIRSRLAAIQIDAIANTLLRRALMNGPDQRWLERVSTLLVEGAPRVPVTYSIEADRLSQIDLLCFAFYRPERTASKRAELFYQWFKGGKEKWLGGIEENVAAVNDRYGHVVSSLEQFPLERPKVLKYRGDLLLVDFTADPVGTMVRNVDWGDLDRRGLAVVCAVERYKLAHGRYPSALSELVPDQLSSVPLDPWSGRPFSYKQVDPAKDAHGRSYLVYVWGYDNVDDGGKEPQRYYDAIVPPTQSDMDYIVNYVDRY